MITIENKQAAKALINFLESIVHDKERFSVRSSGPELSSYRNVDKTYYVYSHNPKTLILIIYYQVKQDWEQYGRSMSVTVCEKYWAINITDTFSQELMLRILANLESNSTDQQITPEVVEYFDSLKAPHP